MKKSILILICLMTLTINAFSQTWATSGGNFYTNPNSTKVGIGTIPSEFLDITGNSSNTAERLLSGSPFNYCRYQLGRNAVESTFGVAAGSGQFVTGSLASDIILRTEAASQRLILNSGTGNATLIVYNSKVGVNTTSPSKTFDVNGDINFSGALYANGSSGSTGQFLISQGTSTPVWQSGNSYSWLLIGNSGTTPGTNFLGTTDAQKLIFKVNNFQSGLIDWDNSSGTANTFLGYKSGINNNGTNNAAFGYNALFSNSAGNRNTAIGMNALYNNNSDNNTATGLDALFNNYNGICNTGNGDSVLFSNTSGNFNTGLGVEAGFKNATGSDNTCVGAFAGKGSSSNPYSDVVCIGYKAGFVNNTNGNVFIGSNSAIANTSGGENVFIGCLSGFSNINGDVNTYIGHQVAYHGRSAENNVAVGAEALFHNVSGGQATAIGTYALYNAWDGVTNFINDNVALGYCALYGTLTPSNNTGLENTALGYQTLYSNSSGNGNTASGNSALYSNSIGNNNTADGYNSLYSNSSGIYNSAVGAQALYSNTSGNSNVAMGMSALYTNSTGIDNTATGLSSLYNSNADNNTADGYQTLYSNTSGIGNTATGFEALFNNTTAGDATSPVTTYGNTATGFKSLFNNTTGASNVANGSRCLFNNINGGSNTALGVLAMFNNTSGGGNVAVGYSALNNNTTATNNSAVGYHALYSCTTGEYNVGIGSRAGSSNSTENNCTFVGSGADETGNYTDAAAFGNNASATAAGHMVFGDANVIGCYNATGLWTISDVRFKYNVHENVKGLPFILKLRPITYQLNTQALDSFVRQNIPIPTDSLGNPIPTIHSDYSASMNIIHSGFKAQQVDSVALACGFISSIVSRPSNNTDPYALNYAEIVVPVVKAVQELSKSNDSLKQHQQISDNLITQLKTKDSLLTATVNNLMAAVANCCTHGATNKTINNTDNNDSLINTLKIKLAFSEQPTLGDAQPNPNSGSTQIPYFIPDENNNAQIIFTDMLGKIINTTKLIKGYGNITVDTQDLPNGTYVYSLVIDGKIYDSKKMIRSK